MYNKNYPCLINDLISDLNNSNNFTSTLLKIRRKTIQIFKFDEIVKILLPLELRPLCRVVNIRKKTLIIETSSASCKLKLNYEKTKILNKLQSKLSKSILFIDIIINPIISLNQKNNFKNKKYKVSCCKLARNKILFSKESVKSILNVTKYSDDQLRKALKSLAEKLKMISDLNSKNGKIPHQN